MTTALVRFCELATIVQSHGIMYLVAIQPENWDYFHLSDHLDYELIPHGTDASELVLLVIPMARECVSRSLTFASYL